MGVRGGTGAIRDCGFFVLRTPLLAFDFLEEWSRADADTGADHDGSWLQKLLARAEIREALFLASPSLDRAIDDWLTGVAGDRAAGIERAVARYIIRMASRPTPFGLFAGTSHGTIADATNLELGPVSNHRRRTRLDTYFLTALTDSIVAARPPGLRYRPNETLHRSGGRARFVAARWREQVRSHHLVAVQDGVALRAALEVSGAGAAHDEIALAVVAAVGADSDRARTYVGGLIDAQALLPVIAPPVTGSEPLEAVTAAMRDVVPDQVCVLDEATVVLSEIDTAGIGVPVASYREVSLGLERLEVAADPARLFQVDLVVSAPDATLGPAVVGELQRAVDILRRITSDHQDGDLARFRENFARRYGTNAVPLLAALDPETGVGFGPSRPSTPLLAGLDIPVDTTASIPWSRREQTLLGLLSRPAVELTTADIDALTVDAQRALPPAFAMLATIVAESFAAIDRGAFRLDVHGGSGPSGARLLGRFCAADAALATAVTAHLEAEEALDPDAIYAEVVHLPEGHVGNVLHRPVLRGFEIPLLGGSGAPPERQLALSDLLVAVVEGDVVLWSSGHGRRVVPRLTTAHNTADRGIGLYRFLAALQAQGTIESLGWSWGPLADAPVLPRVSCGRLVLAPAQWNVDREEIRALGDRAGVVAWRVARGLPRRVRLVEYDNALLVDFEHGASVDVFLDRVRRLPAVRVEEVVAEPEELCARGPGGRFVHEIVVPFIAGRSNVVPRPATAVATSFASANTTTPSLRSFPPGSDWVFACLYAAPTAIDELLREVALPISELGVPWFFVRYADPDPHLRLRVRGGDGVRAAIEAAAQPALADGRVWRLAFDTYEREVGRYGGPDAIDACEAVFHADSAACLGIVLRLSPGDLGADQRWRLVLRGSDMLLADLHLDLAGRLDLVRSTRASFAREFGCDARLESQLSERFRALRPKLELLLDPVHDADSSLAPGLRLLRARSAAVRAPMERLRSLGVAELVAPSLLHMFANRILRSTPRQQEFVIADFLGRLYRSRLARSVPQVTDPM